MRLLFTFAGGRGHFTPLVPLAREAERRGHRIAFAGQRALLDVVRQAGFPAFDTGGASVLDVAQRLPLAPVDRQHEERVMAQSYAGRRARERARSLTALAKEWAPDIVVSDEADFGALLAAEVLGIPHAVMVVMAAGSLTRNEVVGDSLNTIRAELDLPADPDMAMLRGDLVISPFPARLRHPSLPLPADTVFFRPSADPLLLNTSGARPTVYATLGTVFHLESGDLFERILAGLQTLPVDVIMTVGREIDPAAFGTRRAGIRIERYIPQSEILPHCDLVLSHAGSGSVLGALTHGLPLVMLPMGADQPDNVDRCVDLGVGVGLDAVAATAEEIGRATDRVLGEPQFRQAAERVQAEIAAFPGPEHAVLRLESLSAA